MSWAIEKKGYSQRRACGLIGWEPKTHRYASTRGDDAAVRVRLRGLAGERRRFGYRRLLILFRREGLTLNHKKLFRLYREERLSVRRRGGRKRALGTRAPAASAGRGAVDPRPAAGHRRRRIVHGRVLDPGELDACQAAEHVGHATGQRIPNAPEGDPNRRQGPSGIECLRHRI